MFLKYNMYIYIIKVCKRDNNNIFFEINKYF